MQKLVNLNRALFVIAAFALSACGSSSPQRSSDYEYQQRKAALDDMPSWCKEFSRAKTWYVLGTEYYQACGVGEATSLPVARNTAYANAKRMIVDQVVASISIESKTTESGTTDKVTTKIDSETVEKIIGKDFGVMDSKVEHSLISRGAGRDPVYIVYYSVRAPVKEVEHLIGPRV